MMAKPMKTFELHYPMIQFLIISVREGTFFIGRGGSGYFGNFFAKKVVALPLPKMD